MFSKFTFKNVLARCSKGYCSVVLTKFDPTLSFEYRTRGIRQPFHYTSQMLSVDVERLQLV